MRVSYSYTPVSITFENSKEWADFREFLRDTSNRMMDRIDRQDSWFKLRGLTDHEKNVASMITKILQETRNFTH